MSSLPRRCCLTARCHSCASRRTVALRPRPLASRSSPQSRRSMRRRTRTWGRLATRRPLRFTGRGASRTSPGFVCWRGRIFRIASFRVAARLLAFVPRTTSSLACQFREHVWRPTLSSGHQNSLAIDAGFIAQSAPVYNLRLCNWLALQAPLFHDETYIYTPPGASRRPKPPTGAGPSPLLRRPAISYAAQVATGSPVTDPTPHELSEAYGAG